MAYTIFLSFMYTFCFFVPLVLNFGPEFTSGQLMYGGSAHKHADVDTSSGSSESD